MKVAVFDRFSFTAVQRLKLHPQLQLLEGDQTTEAQVAVIRTKTKINADFLNQHKNLKFVVTATSGFDHIDLSETKSRNILVAFCPEGNVHSAAELTIMLALSLARKIEKARAAIRKGDWNRDILLGHELYQKTWGIMGLGRIGRKVASIAHALGMEVIASDPYVEDEVFKELQVERVGLKELYTGSDILSLHVPLTDKTKGIVNLRTMEMMNPHLLLVNTSRGGVILEPDLIEGLRRKMIAGCALDVFQEEPLNPKSALLDLENMVFTPHLGGNTEEAFERSCHLAIDKVEAFFQGLKVSGNPFDEPWQSQSKVF